MKPDILETKLLGFAGMIGSGKTTVSQKIAKRLKWGWASFGDLLRAEASRRHLDASSRLVLQDLGQEMIDIGWKAFCGKLLESANWKPGKHLVIDSIRHVEAVETLKELTRPSHMWLVYVATPETLRRSRVANDQTESSGSVNLHPVEAQTKGVLQGRADFVIDNSLSVAQAVATIFDWIAPRM